MTTKNTPVPKTDYALPKWEGLDDLASHFTETQLLEVPKEIKEFCQEKNWDYRWLNSKQYAEKGGRHDAHWQALNISAANIKLSTMAWGKRADGYLYYGDLVLGVRPKKLTAAHNKALKEKADRLVKSAPTRGAQELKDTMRRAGIKGKVFEGFDDV